MSERAADAAAVNVDLEGWKVMIGGSALPTELTRTALERGIDVFGGYGMSEIFPAASVAQLTSAKLMQDTERQVNARVAAGRPLPLVELRTVDDQLHDLPHDGNPRVKWSHVLHG